MAVVELLDEAIVKLQDAKALVETEKSEAKEAGRLEGDKEGFDRGYAEGKASVVLPEPGTGEKLFTQEDMDKVAAIAKDEVRGELQPQIDKLTADLEASQGELAAVKAELEQFKAELDQKVADGVQAGIAAFKADLKQKYIDQQVAEAQGETGFGALLD